MPGLELHKRADKSGEPNEDGSWPLTHVELVSDELPEDWGFSDTFVDNGVKEGWITFEGTPISYDVIPDPLGPQKSFPPTTLSTPGDTIVLSLVKNGEPVEVRYKIVRTPIPRYWRQVDENERSGFYVEHDYKVKVVK